MLTGMDFDRLKDEVIKPYINDTIDTDGFAPNNRLKVHDKIIFTENGIFTFKKGVRYFISGCAAGGSGLNGVGGASGQWVVSKQFEFPEDKTVNITVGMGNTVVGDMLTLIAAYNRGCYGTNLDGSAPSTTPFSGLPGRPGNGYSYQGSLYRSANGGGAGNGTPFGIGGDGGNSGNGRVSYDYASPEAGKTGTGYGTGGGAAGCATNYENGTWSTSNAPGSPGIVIIEW